MTELLLLLFLLALAFVLAPLATNRFFLDSSIVYSRAHTFTLIFLFIGALFRWDFLTILWPLFCIFGFLLYLKKAYRTLFSVRHIAVCIPFVFSLISSLWFFAGAHDLHLLGYNRTWSFYAALHGSYLGWLFVGCLAFLSRRSRGGNLYLASCYLCFVFFLLVAFGIDGTPYIKRIGVVGLSLIVPTMVGTYLFNLPKDNRRSRYLAGVSLVSVLASMTFAILNEFWSSAPKAAFGLPVMAFAHGSLNAILTVPCFLLAIWFEADGINNPKQEVLKPSPSQSPST